MPNLEDEARAEEEEEEEEDEEAEESEERLLVAYRNGLRGMHNIGNTCYLNSGVQVVANCDIFSYMIEEGGRGKGRAEEVRKERLLGRWQQLLSSIRESGNSTPINPRLFWQDVMSVNQQFIGFGQQDSHEFITALIAALDDVLRDPFHIPSLLKGYTSTTPTDPASLHELQLHTYLDTLYKTNIKLDQLCSDRVAKRKGKINFSSGAYYPRIYRSSVTDLFQGRVASSVTCGGCNQRGRRVEPFTCLTLEMPSVAQLRSIREASKEKEDPQDAVSTEVRGNVFYNTYLLMSGLVRSLITSTLGIFGNAEDEPLTLRECLAAHCRDEAMTRSNKYECPHCDGLQDAVKKLNLLELPEYLVINFKRWDHSNYWTRKINNHVSFPLDWTSGSVEDTDEVLDLAEFFDTSDLPLPPTTTYTLTGLVTHRGSYFGGHYVSYVLKRGRWVLCNDSMLGLTTREVIASEQAYILVYKRQALSPPDRKWDKEKASSYLASLSQYGPDSLAKKIKELTSSEPVFISKNWLIKCALATDAGLIPNRTSYPFDAADDSPSSVAEFKDYYCPITLEDWEYFLAKYGGGPLVTMADYLKCVTSGGHAL